MWSCNHLSDCQDQTRYDATYQRNAVLDNECNVVEADPTNGEMVSACCASCDVPATWIEGN